MNKNKKISAFTLIELLMVIAIIGILAGILIPTVGAVRTQANLAASRAQLSNYVNAIQMFKGEYGFLPFVSGSSDEKVNLSSVSECKEFMETLSARSSTTGRILTTPVGGNRRLISFLTFSESEFFLDDNDQVDPTQIADRFNNTKITIVIDGNGDQRVTVKDSNGRNKEIRALVSAYVEDNDDIGAPRYSLAD
ncbi:MAG: prepilin-type N-terminal cleavage/methylation domain-containing protein [Puniceicoccaceae bacterium]|nr:prepilin-type N-terminal cleavage/methylation domain-containing protein [Puniceicoccaceae bacterium]